MHGMQVVYNAFFRQYHGNDKAIVIHLEYVANPTFVSPPPGRQVQASTQPREAVIRPQATRRRTTTRTQPGARHNVAVETLFHPIHPSHTSPPRRNMYTAEWGVRPKQPRRPRPQAELKRCMHVSQGTQK